MTLLLLAVSFLVAVLSGLGVGSAGLLVVYLVFVEQLPQLVAQGLNLLFFLFSSGAALTVHLLRTPLPYGYLLFLLMGGLPCALLGAHFATLLPALLLRRLFGFFLIICGLLGLLKPKKPQNGVKNTQKSRNGD